MARAATFAKVDDAICVAIGLVGRLQTGTRDKICRAFLLAGTVPWRTNQNVSDAIAVHVGSWRHAGPSPVSGRLANELPSAGNPGMVASSMVRSLRVALVSDGRAGRGEEIRSPFIQLFRHDYYHQQRPGKEKEQVASSVHPTTI